MNQSICPSCNQPVEVSDKFCPRCGNQLTQTKESKPNVKTITSSGNYTGTMVKGKTSRGWKIFRYIIIAIVLLGIIALIIWFQVDPDAGKKLTDALMGIAFMIVFFFVGWLFMRGKKGRRGSNYDDPYNDVSDDNDFDDDDD